MGPGQAAGAPATGPDVRQSYSRCAEDLTLPRAAGPSQIPPGVGCGLPAPPFHPPRGRNQTPVPTRQSPHASVNAEPDCWVRRNLGDVPRQPPAPPHAGGSESHTRGTAPSAPACRLLTQRPGSVSKTFGDDAAGPLQCEHRVSPSTHGSAWRRRGSGVCGTGASRARGGIPQLGTRRGGIAFHASCFTAFISIFSF